MSVVPPHSYLRDAWWRCLPGGLPVAFTFAVTVGGWCGVPLPWEIYMIVMIPLIGLAFASACCDMVDVVVASRRGIVVKWAMVNVFLFAAALVFILLKLQG